MKERKKAELKPIPKVEPKKRGAVKEENEVVKGPKPKKVVEPIKTEIESKTQDIGAKDDILVTPSTPKTKKSDDKYIRIASDAPMEERRLISERVLKNELQFGYYAVDGDSFYHYYLVIKK